MPFQGNHPLSQWKHLINATCIYSENTRNPDPGCSFEVSNPHRLRNLTWSGNAARDFSVHLPSKSAAAEDRMKGTKCYKIHFN